MVMTHAEALELQALPPGGRGAPIAPPALPPRWLLLGMSFRGGFQIMLLEICALCVLDLALPGPPVQPRRSAPDAGAEPGKPDPEVLSGFFDRTRNHATPVEFAPIGPREGPLGPAAAAPGLDVC